MSILRVAACLAVAVLLLAGCSAPGPKTPANAILVCYGPLTGETLVIPPRAGTLYLVDESHLPTQVLDALYVPDPGDAAGREAAIRKVTARHGLVVGRKYSVYFVPAEDPARR